jgi:hypothetical protein
MHVRGDAAARRTKEFEEPLVDLGRLDAADSEANVGDLVQKAAE